MSAQAADITISDTTGWDSAIVRYEQNPYASPYESLIINAEGTTLTLNSKVLKTDQFTLNAGTVKLDDSGMLYADQFTLNGGRVELDDREYLYTNTFTMTGGTLRASGGTLSVQNIFTYAQDGDLKTSIFNSCKLKMGALMLKEKTAVFTMSEGARVTFYGLGASEAFSNASAINVVGKNASSILYLGDKDDPSATKGGSYAGNITVNAKGKIEVSGNKDTVWKLTGTVDLASNSPLDGNNYSLLVNSGTLDLGEGTLKTTTDAKIATKDEGMLVIKSGDFTLSGNAIDTTNSSIKVEIENDGILKIVGAVDSITDSTTYQAYVDAITSTNNIISFDKDVTDRLVGSITLATAGTDLKGLALTNNVVNAGSATDILTADTYVQGVDATKISGDTYTVSGSTLTLAGNTEAGKALIETKDANTKISVENLQLGMAQIESSTGTLGNLTITDTLSTVNGEYTIDTLDSKSTSVTNSILTVTGDMKSTGDAGGIQIASNGTLHIKGTLTAANSVNILNGGTLLADGLMDVTAQQNVIVGESSPSTTPSSGGTLIAKELHLGDNLLFATTEWLAQDAVSKGDHASKVAVENFTGAAKNTLDGNYYAGQASQISLGTTDTTILSKLLDDSKTWGKDITAALYIDKSIVLGVNSALHVNGAADNIKTPPASAERNTAHFADKSLLAVNVANLDGKAAISAAGNTAATATIDAGAKLYLTNAQNNKTYTILGDFTAGNINYAADGWSGMGNLLQSVTVLNPDSIKTDGKLEVVIGAVEPESVIPKLDGALTGMLVELNEKGLNNVDSPNAGARFLSRAISGRMSADEASATIEGASRLAMVGATQGVTMSAVTAGSSAATSRTSMASPLQAQKAQAVALNGESMQNGLNAGDMRNGVGLWVMPLYQSTNTWGMKAGEFKTGSTSDLGGVALGADYTFNDAFRVGVAFNLGGGYGQSKGDFNKTSNNFNFWGVNLYGGWAQNNFGLTADVGYTSTYSKLDQELQSSMDMGSIKADVTSSTITAGLRGEYKFETSALDIIPHVGVRYMSLKTDSYDAKSNGTVFSADESYQSIWTFPIGVTLSKEIESASGWTFKPQMDLQVIPAAGDVKAKSRVSVPGLDSTADLTTRVMDDISYGGGVGFDIRKDNVSFGINYNIQASEHSTAQGVTATVRYEF